MDRLSDVIHVANWVLVISLLVGLVATVVTVVFGRRLERLRTNQDLAQQERIEEMRRENLELEQSLAPRRLVMNGVVEKSLAQFVPINITFWTINDFEAQNAAKWIKNFVEAGGWRVPGPFRSPPEGVPEGVTVVSHRPPLHDPNGDAEERRLQNAADALVDILKAQGWQAETHGAFAWGDSQPDNPWHVPPGTLYVLVGFKPATFFDFPQVKQMRQLADSIREEARRRRNPR